MDESSNTSFLLENVDFPHEGVDAADWIRLSPARPSYWCSIKFTAEGTGIEKSYFLGAGHTEFSQELFIFGTVRVLCIQGYVYVVSDTGVTVMPSVILGYTQLTTSETYVVFANYSELLIVAADGTYRYNQSVAIDSLRVISVFKDEILVSGLRRYSDDEEEWSIRVAELSIEDLFDNVY